MVTSNDTTPDTADRDERKRRYEEVVRVVELQTSGDLLPWVRECHVTLNRYHAGYDPDAIHRTLQAAVENGDVVRWTREGNTVYTPRTEAALRRVIEREVKTVGEPNRQLVAFCNEHIADLRKNE